MSKPGHFSWNELVATNEAVAKKFYTHLFGWQSELFGAGLAYTLFKKNGEMAGGMMKCPKPGIPAHWLAYVTVENVDATATAAVKLGGEIAMPPQDVPEVGRIAVVIDPQGAAIGLFKPLN